MKYGVILMRAQPMHLGHLDVIKQASKENDKVLVFIGSANKCGTERNPLNIDDRYFFVKSAIIDEDLDNVIVKPLNDWSKEDAYALVKEWGRFFYYNAVNELGSKTFTLYYNDDIEIARNWFDEELQQRISIVNSPRVRDVTATKVREAILNDDKAYLKSMLPYIVYSNRNYIKEVIETADKEDFIMC